MDLQTAFYILGIIYMAVSLIIVVAILIAVLVIKAKIDHVHRVINEKVNTVKDVTAKVAAIFGTARHFVKR